ncbi:hypothetical protein [Clostridium chromiireducens]|uniref:TATA-box binding protein n=1 Tax=Clostridium chromiireducens TaxID=225345 RepID=A0A1V4IVJ7_9CLOT|nr:hypothetical protein [Clostridium chromiireducens]OPJ64071.1 hypothetical protein CLCHR_13250 [Clostridium chromiireducens]RII32428.1 hypothetical protein D2A34_22375 [Clostridium chromiireducens]
MNIRLSIIAFILLSFLNIGAISKNMSDTDNSFSIIENNISCVSEFEENGVKFQYKTKETIDIERFRIKECLTKDIKGLYKELGENEFEIINEDLSASVKLWSDTQYNFVEIILINKNSKYSATDLKNIVHKLDDHKLKDIQYFLYYEGKIDDIDNENLISKFISENNLQDIKTTNINNGYVGTGYLNNKDRINFAQVKYNTGSHIIIGTPIIFATY